MGLKIVIDSREQAPYAFAGHQTEAGTLQTGDYSLAGLEHLISVERKELGDFLGCLTHGRDRFKRELQRLRGWRFRCIVIEATMGDILAHKYRSQIAPAAVVGALASWQARYETPFILAGDRAGGEAFTLAFLSNVHRQLAEFVATLRITT